MCEREGGGRERRGDREGGMREKEEGEVGRTLAGVCYVTGVIFDMIFI